MAYVKNKVAREAFDFLPHGTTRFLAGLFLYPDPLRSTLPTRMQLRNLVEFTCLSEPPFFKLH